MKNLEVSDLENIFAGNFSLFWYNKGRHIFYTLLTFEVSAAVGLLIGIASQAYLHNCKLSLFG